MRVLSGAPSHVGGDAAVPPRLLPTFSTPEDGELAGPLGHGGAEEAGSE